jgi:hypothetical protein
MRRHIVVMTKLQRMLMTAMMLSIISVGAFAQGDKREQKPPPKEDTPKVRVEENKKPPPPSGNQQEGRKGDDKRGKP